MTRIRIASPEGSVGARVNALAPLPVSLNGLRIGVLDNRKPNAQRLLTGIAQHVARKAGMEVAVLASKGNAAEPSEGEVLDKLRVSADVVLTGSGD